MNKVGNKSPKLGKKSANLLTVSEAAQALGISERTCRYWCESGKLPALSKAFGHKTTYLVSPTTIAFHLAAMASEREAKEGAGRRDQRSLGSACHENFIDNWLQAMRHGLIDGKPFSQRTIADYHYYVKLYFTKYKVLSSNHIAESLAKIPLESFATKDHLYKALLCFSKVLIQEGALDEVFLQEVKRLKPRRNKPPKRHTVNENDLNLLLEACEDLTEKTLLLVLSKTGLRASECCSLNRADIDLGEGVLNVCFGKGGRSRRVGLSSDLAMYLGAYLNQHSHKALFLNSINKPLTPRGLYHRLECLGRRVGVKVHPHALRRCFVTVNANKGRPLQMLQRACGHSTIQTTMNYCRTSEQEVITAMQGWG